MNSHELKVLSLDQLIELAEEKHILDEWHLENGHVHLRAGIIDVTLDEKHARTYLQGLIRGHEISSSLNLGE